LGALEGLIGQALALTKTPLDLIRGTGGEEKVLKNAKDSCAAEALEIATYTALAQLARTAEDAKTERLAKSVLADEEKMLDRLLKEIPRLTDAVARAELDGNGSYDVTETGAADTLREVGDTAKRTARQTRKVPGIARAEGTVKGAVASASDLAIANYDSLSAEEIQEKLSGLSQIDLAKVNAYERKNQNRSTITSRIDSLQADEPWPGYDELGVDEVRAVLSEGDDSQIKAVRTYERKHKNRAGVLQATERELSNA
jgi:rubrerythrin